MKPFLLVAFLAQVTFAAAPTLTELQPRGAERGRPFTLTVVGRDIPDGSTLSSTMPATFTPVAPSANAPAMMMTMPGRTATFLVEPKDTLLPGVYPLRLESAAGISNVLLFSVGSFPEQTEEESTPYSRPNKNDTIENAQPLPAGPLTLNGTLQGAERDLFRISAKAGEHRVMEISARRSGSAIDPSLRLLDGAGKELARSDDAPGIGLDARIDFTFARDGYYYLEVHDTRFSRQVQNHYRLTMGDFRFADGIYPLGGKAGENTEVTFFGGNLPAPVKAHVKTGGREMAHAVLPGSPVSSFLFASSEYPEFAETTDLVPVPAAVNGRLLQAAETDRFRFDVKAGDKLLFELQARELGTSKLEGVITLRDAAGKKLDSAGDKPLIEDVFAVAGSSRTSSDPYLNYTVPEGSTELIVSVEDLAQRGGPLYGYRLIARKQSQDFVLSLSNAQVNIPEGGSVSISAVADRRGYDGPIQLLLPDLPTGISVEGGTIPKEYVDASNARTLNRRGVLVLTAERGVRMAPRDLVVYGEGTLADGTVLRRRARGPALSVEIAGATSQGVVDRQRPLTAPWLGYDLPAAVAAPPIATLVVTQTKVNRMEEGDRYDFEYRWNLKGKGAMPAADPTVDIIGARDIRVTNMKQSSEKMADGTLTGSFSINTTKATDPAHYDMIVRGRIKMDDGEEEVVARPIAVIIPERSTIADVSTAR